MWRAINTLTKGHSPANNNLPSELTPDVFNAHFLSVVSKFLPDDQTDGFQYNCRDRLLNFCSDRISQNTTFLIPPISVFETTTPPIKSKVRDHANRASFKTSPTWNNVQLKWQTHINNTCKTISRRIFFYLFFSLLCTRYVTYELRFKCMGWMCLCAHEEAIFSPQTCRKMFDANS